MVSGNTSNRIREEVKNDKRETPILNIVNTTFIDQTPTSIQPQTQAAKGTRKKRNNRA